MKEIRTLVVLVFLSFISANINKIDAQQQRPFKVDDMFKLEDMGNYYGGAYSFSPDGKTLAFTKLRSERTSGIKLVLLSGNERGDIWIQNKQDEVPLNITNGGEDLSGSWCPRWSPDGKKLAFLSTKGNENIYLWIWDTNTKSISRIINRNINIPEITYMAPFAWVDSDNILFSSPTKGELPSELMQIPTMISKEWAKTQSGKEAAVSELQSGAPADFSNWPKSDLIVCNVKNQTENILLKDAGPSLSWELSPNKKFIFFNKLINLNSLSNDKPIRMYDFFNQGRYQMGLIRLDGTSILKDSIGIDVNRSSIRWSENNDELVFLGYEKKDNYENFHLYKINLNGQTLAELKIPDLQLFDNSRLEFVSQGNLILSASKKKKNIEINENVRNDWWLISKNGTIKNLTQDLKDPFDDIFPLIKGRKEFLYTANDGKVYMMDPETRKITNLTSGFSKKVYISYPAKGIGVSSQQFNQPIGETIFSIVVKDDSNYYSIDLTSRIVKKINKPNPEAEIVAFEPVTGTAMFHKSNHDGLKIWRSDTKTDKTAMLVETNNFLKTISGGSFKHIEYVSLNGEKLEALILLPFGYEKGKQYPLLTSVYYGRGWSESDDACNIASATDINMQIPAAQGYAILFPTMPMGSKSVENGDPLLRLTDGVLPAVDKAIELGIADPNRLFLMGHSLGGFSTYGIITQTKRFTAALSFAGPSNFISFYGQFDTRNRYTTYAHKELFHFTSMEEAQGEMNNPPWKDFARYTRNSPIFYVERVQTPVMIVQGDMDIVPIQQGEEFFNALYRQGKRASFVRYWGEGHSLSSPANIRDMWSRAFSWFDEFGDIKRDGEGNLLWDGDKVMSRKGAPALKPGDFLKFSRFFDQD